MQSHYNEHCLGLGRQALILHGSHRELGPFRAAEDPYYHSPSEVLALPRFSYGRPTSTFTPGSSHLLRKKGQFPARFQSKAFLPTQTTNTSAALWKRASQLLTQPDNTGS